MYVNLCRVDEAADFLWFVSFALALYEKIIKKSGRQASAKRAVLGERVLLSFFRFKSFRVSESGYSPFDTKGCGIGDMCKVRDLLGKVRAWLGKVRGYMGNVRVS